MSGLEVRRVIYIFRDEGYIKVGRTSGDPLGRLSQVQTGAPRRVTLVALAFTGLGSKAEERLERRCHAALEPYLVRGEWFELPATHRLPELPVQFTPLTSLIGSEVSMDEADSDLRALLRATLRVMARRGQDGRGVEPERRLLPAPPPNSNMEAPRRR